MTSRTQSFTAVWCWIALAACAVVPRESMQDAPIQSTSRVVAEADEPEADPAPPPCLRPPRPLSDDGVFYVLGADPAHPRVRYLDGQISLNDTCAIRRGSKLNRRVPPMFVNGQPIGFC